MSEEIQDEIEDSLIGEKEEEDEIKTEPIEQKIEKMDKKDDVSIMFRIKRWDTEDAKKAAMIFAKSQNISRATPSAVAKFLLEDLIQFYRQKGRI